MKNKPNLIEREDALHFYMENKEKFAALYRLGEMKSIEQQLCQNELTVGDLANLLDVGEY